MAGEIAERKRSLRARIRARRGEMSTAELAVARDGLTAQLQELVRERGMRSLSCFLPMHGEPDTTLFLDWAGREGIDVLLPCAREDGLLDWVRPSGEGAVVGAFGIPEPLGEVLSPLAAGELDLMLVPAAAIGLRGQRLGWGRGYFDRNLASMARRPLVFALVHEHELLDEVPVEPHDVPVDGVVTPERVLVF